MSNEDEDGKEIELLKGKLRTVCEDIFSAEAHSETVKISISSTSHCKAEEAATLRYAEVDAESFLDLIRGLKDFDVGFHEDACFVDVGCGPAKTLVTMSLLNIFKRAIGVEINTSLARRAYDSVKKYNKSYRSPVDVTEMEIVTGDGTYYDWSFASLVYIQATCFSEEMMIRLTDIADKMKPGAVLIVVNNRLLRETCFDLIGILSVEYTFGPATALLYRKSALGTCSNVAIATAKLAEVLSREIVF